MEENIEKILDEMLKSKDNPIKVEYLFDLLREYIQDKRDIYKETLKKYNIDELNAVLKLGFNSYKERALKLFYKEIFICLSLLVLLTIFSVFVMRLDSSILFIILMTFIAVYTIVRTGAYKKKLKSITEALYKQNIEKEIMEFVEGLKNE